MLAERGAAWVIGDTDEQPWTSEDIPGTAFAYLRLRRADYDRAAIEEWGTRIGRALSRGTDVFCFVKHEEDAAGPELAEAFQRAGSGAQAVTGP